MNVRFVTRVVRYVIRYTIDTMRTLVPKRIYRFAILLLILLYIGAIALLLWSVVFSGYHYVFDSDELSHGQVAYLILQGKRPFVDFFTIYSPLFHWLIAPVLLLRGFTFDAILGVRAVMIGLFIIRLISGVALAAILFGRLAALAFIPLLLIDPLTTFNGMQIRPDNLMLTLFVLGLTVSARGIIKKHTFVCICGGVLLGISCIVSMKILPIILPVFGMIMLSDLIHRRWGMFLHVLAGAILAVAIYFALFLFQGSFSAMIQQSFFDPKTTNDALLYPVNFGNYYIPGNVYIYGVMGKPLTWMYTLILPFLGFAGSALAVMSVFQKKKKEGLDFFVVGLACGYTFYVLSLLFIHSVFSQYYLPLSFFAALFAAAGIAFFIHAMSAHASTRWVIAMSAAILIVPFGVSAYKNNLFRAAIGNRDVFSIYRNVWSQIPENAPVFPGFLYRPISYPITYGYYLGDIPQAIKNRYPSVPDVLEQQRTPYVLLDDQSIAAYGQDTERYIKSRYTRISPNVMIRKGNTQK